MKYQIIYADPPWAYSDKRTGGSHQSGASQKYSCMTLADICALPVSQIAANDSILFMWCTWPHYESATMVMSAWGFTYKTIGFVWIKTTKKAQLSQASFFPHESFDDVMGLGHWTRGNTEFCLIGVKGKPKRKSANVRQIIYAPIAQHSRKPDGTRDRIIELVGELPRIELFAREKHAGWAAWGNEVESDVELAA